MKALPCVWCERTPCDNAHVSGAKGVGYKAGYDHIAPLCRECHSAFDEHRFPFDADKVRDYVKSCPPRIEQLWQAQQNPEHISSIVRRVMKDIA